MKASELRIGNLVKDRGGKILRIDYWERPGMIAQNVVIDGMTMHPLTELVDYLNPIRITREAVADFFGLTETDDHDNHIIKSNPNNTCKDITLWIASEGGIAHVYVGDNQGATVTIHSIHELQNVYFALTKEELEVKD